ncbi:MULTISPECIES: sensor histidine kinase [unclassified Duganella]|uniref:sensor histidine kinase n=1 Tax=unclassified Duganella TaxID=2636909 RepID=UPI000E3561A6|nr:MULTISPECIES: histidine kinase [unclassified Duganella]RFP09662.1 sensor histidine kinase [Duganella sp. BJB475]RFP27782.1 sensor histidine kinase [Duganella sp. BJB476]
MTNDRPLLARMNWYWLFQLAGWNFLPLLMLAMSPGADHTPRIYAIALWGVVAGLLISDTWHRLLKRQIRNGVRISWKMMAVAILILGALHAGVQTVGYLVIKPMGKVHGIAWVPGVLMFWWGVYLVWNIFYMAVLSLRRANRLEQEALRLEISAKDAELRALQAQVNPHFFFNSMNSVRALIYEDQDSAAQMIDQLASVMRYALQSGQHDTVPLAAEIEAVQAYLAIEKIRFEERMRVSVEIGLGLDQVRIPPMALQTLVENAVKYGVETSPTGSEIRIRAQRMDDGKIHIEIANLGAILPFANSTKVGLVNTRKRLALALGSNASLDLTENSGWVRATMTLPEAA